MTADRDVEELFSAEDLATRDYAVLDGVKGSKSIVFGSGGVLLGMVLIEDDELNARAATYLIGRGAKTGETVEDLGWSYGTTTTLLD